MRIPIAPYHPQYDVQEESSGCGLCCIITSVVLAILTTVFLLNFFGVLPFGSDTEVIEPPQAGGAKLTFAYKGPWGTKITLKMADYNVSHYVWFENVAKVAKKDPTAAAKIVLKSKSGCEKIVKEVSKTFRNAIKKEYSGDQTGLQMYDKIAPLAETILADLLHASETVLALVEKKDWMGLKDVCLKGIKSYVSSNKLDSKIPSEFKGLYKEMKPILLECVGLYEKVPESVWEKMFQGDQAAMLVHFKDHPECATLMKKSAGVLVKHKIIAQEQADGYLNLLDQLQANATGGGAEPEPAAASVTEGDATR